MNDSEELTCLIRDTFLLSRDAEISSDLMNIFKSCQVSNHFEALQPYLNELRNGQPSILVTHDIDWLNPRHPYSFINELRRLLFKHNWIEFSQCLDQEIFLNQINEFLEIEKTEKVLPVYCFGANSTSTYKRFALRYSIHSTLTKRTLESVLQAGAEIGLQSSYHASQNGIIPAEKKELENVIKQPVKFHRSHYLHYQPLKLYALLEQAGISYDLGLGTSRMPLIRNGYAGIFRPYDPRRKQLFNVKVIPLILMDNAFFFHSPSEVFYHFKKCLGKVIECKGTACIAWHPENTVIRPQLKNHFKEILHICKEEGVSLNTTHSL